MGDYEVIMDGGGPWGIRLQGGKDFGVPLNVARVTPGSKASMKGLLAGDHIISINNNDTEQLTHMEAQNLIKGAGDRLQLRLKKGHGTSLGEAKEIGAGGFKTSPQQTLYQTDVTHSAGVDHKFNAKPKSFITSTNAGGGSAGGVTHVSTPLKKFDPEDYSRKNEPVSAPVKKFDPGEYARKKKEELESYKKDSTKPHDLVDSDVLKMLQKTSVSDPKQTSGLSHGTPDDAGQPEGDVAFRMTAEGTDLSDVSPGSRAVMEDIKNRGTSTLSSSGAASGGSRSFRLLQHITSLDEDLPPPPPELMDAPDFDVGSGSPPQVQSNTFRMLQHHVDAGTADQVATGLDKPRNPSQSNIGQPMGRNTSNTQSTVTVNPIPKAPFPTGPNFKVGKAAAPTFKSSSGSHIGPRAPPPPAVNAGEVVNPNSRLYQANANVAQGPHVGVQVDYGTKVPNNISQSSPPGGAQYGREPQHPPQREQSFSPQREQPASPQNTGAVRGPPSQSGEKKLVCQACDQPMTGPFVSAIGKTWHPEHFCCSSCHVSLQNQAFVEENSKLFCEKCYNQFYAPKCAHCNNSIIGEYGKDTKDAICDICSAVASSRGVYDPIVCSKSINWLSKQLREANETYEHATRKKEEEHVRLVEAKQKIMSINKRRAVIEDEIEKLERNFENVKRMLQYKMKLSAANANLCSRMENFRGKISIVEDNLKKSRERLNGWQQKFTAVVGDYKEKCNRLEDIQRRKQESHGRVNGLEYDLMKMKQRIKVLNGKKSFRKAKIQATQDEMENMEEEIRDAETRQMLSEQHIMSLGIYQESMQHEYVQYSQNVQNVREQLSQLLLLKQKKLQARNSAYQSLKLLQ